MHTCRHSTITRHCIVLVHVCEFFYSIEITNASVDGLIHNIIKTLNVCILGVEVEKKINRIEDRLGYNQLQSVHT